MSKAQPLGAAREARASWRLLLFGFSVCGSARLGRKLEAYSTGWRLCFVRKVLWGRGAAAPLLSFCFGSISVESYGLFLAVALGFS